MKSTVGPELLEGFSKRRKVLAGVSGGRDSVALLHLLHEAGFSNVVVCHLNHRLRGRESGQDAAFVRRLARKYGYPAEIESADVRKRARKRKQSIETAARHARHELFAEVSRKNRCNEIFLAHHADDQVETVLINLCRGAGLPGLAGMSRESRIEVGRRKLNVLRPLLAVSRNAIDDYITAEGLAFREDPTNAETEGSTRNRVRHELLPVLKRVFDRDPRQAILRTAKLAAAEDAALDAMVQELWLSAVDSDGSLKTRGLLRLAAALQRRVILRWLRERSTVPETGFREVERIRSILDPAAATSKVNLPGRWHARRRRGRIFLEPGAPNSA